jgi:Flp pilus assembly pilin Flp
MRFLVRLLREDEAATAVEYAVMLALILMAMIGTIGAFGQGSGGMWGGINKDLQTVGFIK